jgi:hypothetical protein
MNPRRPTSLHGLIARVAWLHRGRLAAAACALIVAAAIAHARSRHDDATSPLARRCDVYEHWNAGLHIYDYLDSVDLRRRTRGEAVRGESQSIWSITRFDVRRLAERSMEWSHFVEIDPYTGEEHPSDAPAQQIGFRIEQGEFVVIVPEPTRRVERVYQCRLRFDGDEAGPLDDYYSVLLRSRPIDGAGPRAE